MSEAVPTPGKVKRRLSWRAVVGVMDPGNRGWDKRIRNGVVLTAVVGPLLTMTSRTLDRYAEENAKTQAALRDSMTALPGKVADSVVALKLVLEPMVDDLAALRESNTEMRGWVQGRLRCPPCVCPDTSKTVRFVPAGKDAR